MDFWFEFLNIQMNEKKKLAMIAMALNGKYITIYQILTIFLCGPTPFLARWIVTIPKKRILKPMAHYVKNISWN
jgi:hypothetical protein